MFIHQWRTRHAPPAGNTCSPPVLHDATSSLQQYLLRYHRSLNISWPLRSVYSGCGCWASIGVTLQCHDWLADGNMSSYFMNSLMQCYCNQTTPMYAAAAVASAAGRGVDDSVGCCTAFNDAAAVFPPSLSSFSRRHQQPGAASHRGPQLQPRTASLSTNTYSFIGTQNMSGSRHSTSLNDPFTDAMVQSASSTSTKLSPLVPHEAKLARHPHVDTALSVYGDYHLQLYDDSLRLNGHCNTYKVERPSPPTTPDTEPRQKDVTETWNSSCSAHYINNKNSGALQTENVKNEGETSENDNDLVPHDDETMISDDDSDDATGSVLTQTSTTVTTASEHHQQQQEQQRRDKSSGDVRQTQRDAVYPIYPWMTRVHSTHGKSCHLVLIQVIKFKIIAYVVITKSLFFI